MPEQQLIVDAALKPESEQPESEPASSPAAEAPTAPAASLAISEGGSGDWERALRTLEDPNANPLQVFLDPAIKDPLWKAANLFAQTAIIPAKFQNRPADVFLALTMAGSLRVNPVAVMQHIIIIEGKPTFESKFFIQLANERGGFRHPLDFKFFGTKGQDDYGCECWTETRDGRRLSASVTIAVAKRAGWVNRKGSWWAVDPDLMLVYRSAAWFVRRFCPQVTMGYLSDQEARDEAGAVRDTASPISAPAPLGLKITDKEKATDAEIS